MNKISKLTSAVLLCLSSGVASAALISVGVFNGNVGLSVDGIGSNAAAVGNVQANIPIGATILQAYLYSAGVPIGYSNRGPSTLSAYNGSGITLAGNPINNFDTLVGATGPSNIWKTARADVTSIVQSLTASAVTNNFSWAVTEGSLNNSIDGEILAIVYSHASRPLGSVALLNGGQNTGGETSFVNFASPLPDPTLSGFVAELGLGISFSCCNQSSEVKINGTTITNNAGNFDDGLFLENGSLITVGGLGDIAAINQSYANDGELYDLRSFLEEGDDSLSIFSVNATNDDNIFFASLYITAEIGSVTPEPINSVPVPAALPLMASALGLGALCRRRNNLS